MKNGHKVVLQGRLASGATVSFAADRWGRPCGGSGGGAKPLKNVSLFMSRG